MLSLFVASMAAASIITFTDAKSMPLKSNIERRQTSPLQRSTAYGPVVGVSQSSTVNTWYGVRFAAPAAGNLRWKAPQAPPSWTSPINAQTKMPCLEVSSSGAVRGTEAGCLTVDIYAPATAVPGSGDLPVVVYFHSGNNAAYSYTETVINGINFVDASINRSSPVIFVIVHFRLGGIGFMGLPALAVSTSPRSLHV